MDGMLKALIILGVYVAFLVVFVIRHKKFGQKFSKYDRRILIDILVGLLAIVISIYTFIYCEYEMGLIGYFITIIVEPVITIKLYIDIARWWAKVPTEDKPNKKRILKTILVAVTAFICSIILWMFWSRMPWNVIRYGIMADKYVADKYDFDVERTESGAPTYSVLYSEEQNEYWYTFTRTDQEDMEFDVAVHANEDKDSCIDDSYFFDECWYMHSVCREIYGKNYRDYEFEVHDKEMNCFGTIHNGIESPSRSPSNLNYKEVGLDIYVEVEEVKEDEELLNNSVAFIKRMLAEGLKISSFEVYEENKEAYEVGYSIINPGEDITVDDLVYYEGQ